MDTPSVEYGIVSTRIDMETLDLLERYLLFVNQREPGLNAKMSTVVRMLVVRGLDQVQKELGPLPPLPKKRKEPPRSGARRVHDDD
jgi:hypothetical protein